MLKRLKLFSEAYVRKTEAAWRKRVAEARPPGYLYYVQEPQDPKAIYIDQDWNNQWKN